MGEGRVPGPLGAGGQTQRAPVPLGAASGRTLEDFKRQVRERQINYLRTVKGRSFIPAVPESDLDVIEGDKKMRRIAAGKCRELLAAARADLKAAKQDGDAKAKKTKSIRVHSAYRDFAEDSAAWESSFRQYYQQMLDDNLYPGEELGKHALQYIVRKMIKLKAPPGYSNHSNGLAVDFGTSVGHLYLGASSALDRQWGKSWLHAWLVEHAASFNFHPLSTEKWHWDYVE